MPPIFQRKYHLKFDMIVSEIEISGVRALCIGGFMIRQIPLVIMGDNGEF